MALSNHAACDPCSMALRATHTLTRAAPGGRVVYCGWCAKRTESGLTVRCDPADVPFPHDPIEARGYIKRFRTYTVPGTDHVDTPSRRIWLDRMSDSEAVFVAGEFQRMEFEAYRRTRLRGATPARRLRLS